MSLQHQNQRLLYTLNNIYIGIDLAWGEKNLSGFCALHVEKNRLKILELSLLKSIEDIVFQIQKYKDCNVYIGVDAPLVIPNETGNREIEKKFNKEFAKYSISMLPANRKILTKYSPNIRSEELFSKLIKLGFKRDKVYKEYIAWVEGIISEPIDVDKPILTTKKNNRATSNVSSKGKPARTEIFPDIVSGNKTKVKCIIHHGRTHQIRTHLRYVDHPIIGDEQYGGRRAKRVMLHAYKVRLFNYEFTAPEPKAFVHFE